jgi:lysophospholipase L1-like esterase
MLLLAIGRRGPGLEPRPRPSSILARTTPGRLPRSATASRSASWKSGRSGANLDTANNYPNVLQGLLQRLDPTWRVINRGRGGEGVQDGATRISDVLRSDRPGFVLIMEGTNNASRCDDAAFIVGRLQTMIQRAKDNRTVPLLGTIPPNFRNDPCARDVIDRTNGLIRGLASAEGIVLAEIFNGMNDRNLFRLTPLRDPLHPNEHGYQVMATSG